MSAINYLLYLMVLQASVNRINQFMQIIRVMIKTKKYKFNYFIVILSFTLACMSNISFAAQPSFNCANASLPDEEAICNDELLAKLDNIANNGYQYLKENIGSDQANALDLPIINKRQSCQNDKNCILAVQIESINLFKSYGAPISAPRIKNMKPYPIIRHEIPQEFNSPVSENNDFKKQLNDQLAKANETINEIKQKAQEEIENARRDGANQERNKQKTIEENRQQEIIQQQQTETHVSEQKNREKSEALNEKLMGIGFVIIILFCIVIYFIPTIIALKRDHEYKWVIFALNFVGGFTGILWIVAIVWAVYPDNRSIADPVLGTFTGKGVRNLGDQLGEFRFGKERGYSTERSKYPNVMPSSGMEEELVALEKLHNLKMSGAITEQEYRKKRDQILSRNT